ncbi:nuclear pore glycoprotein p62 [Orussus abietinus]|uniref:nuclear pore glycoprotein p62 n=1 Tax=Orussus abietinus TaxID=222816 RepID=UPI0006264525|nr:nuclear pore glycoprotein p62 [Orussus abietinus]
MSFAFDASKAQPNALPATTTGGTQGFSLSGSAGAGDASKPPSTGFTLMSSQSQGKPGGMFPSGFGSTQTGFGFGSPATTAAISFGSSLGTVAAAPAANAATPSSGANISFGLSTPATGTGFSLGGAPATTGATGFNLGGTATNTSGLSFGAPLTTTASSGFSLDTGTTSTTTGFQLGNTTLPTSAAPGNTTTTAAPGFGVTPSVAATPAAATFNVSVPTVTTSTTGFSFGTVANSATPGIGLSTTSASSGFMVGKPTTTAAPAITTTTSAIQPTLTSFTTVSSATGNDQTAAINFCQLEESINKWTLELEEQEKAFVNQATQVNAWDKLLIANGEKIVSLNQEVERVKLEQQQLEHELDYVVGQQKELQDCLVPLEKELASLSVSDPEREYTYRLAENLDTQLKQMSEDLKEIIEHLNEANRSQDASDPIVQIGKILNAHMNSLQWLDQRTTLLTQKIQQIDQMHQNFRQENERSFNLAYN